MAKKTVKITSKQIRMGTLEQMSEQSMGYCPICRAWTTGCCEPDARQYPCDKCGEKSVFGAEEAVMLGFLVVVE